ncbi:DUF3861 family protein [Microvirga zambiensis]|uniref:DUF3861 family protein n=1 Tax=Microvirga zambiensis TaxID=1402137 RepID=UPI00191E3499|nr:DUF3861 family protein [Microvirga zambiensis]
MPHTYRISLTHVSDHRGNPVQLPICEFKFTNHDDLGKIIERATRNAIVPEKNIEAFCLGLKLLTEVVMEHRDKPAFAEFWISLGSFIRSIKHTETSTPEN